VISPRAKTAQTSYEIEGKGEPVALIMGFSGSTADGASRLKLMEQRFRSRDRQSRTAKKRKPDAELTLRDKCSGYRRGLDPCEDAARIFSEISMGRMMSPGVALDIRIARAGWCSDAPTAARVIPYSRVGGHCQPDTGPGMDQSSSARAFSVACGKAFLNSAKGHHSHQGIAEIGNYPVDRCIPSLRQDRRLAGSTVSRGLDKSSADPLLFTR